MKLNFQVLGAAITAIAILLSGAIAIGRNMQKIEDLEQTVSKQDEILQMVSNVSGKVVLIESQLDDIKEVQKEMRGELKNVSDTTIELRTKLDSFHNPGIGNR